MNRFKLIRIALAVVICFAAAISLSKFLETPVSPGQLWTPTTQPMLYQNSAPGPDGVTVSIYIPRTYGYRVGDQIPIEMKVSAPPQDHLSFETLEQKQLAAVGTSWQMLEVPQVTEAKQWPDNTWTVNMLVTFWVPNPVPFVAQFLVAQTTQASGQLNWEYGKSPALSVGYSNTAPVVKEPTSLQIDNGPMGDMPNSSSTFGQLSLLVGSLILFGVLATIALFGWKRVRRRELTPEQAFWAQAAEIDADTAYTGWQLDHYMALAAALRIWLGFETFTTSEILAALPEGNERGTITSLFSKLDKVIYEQVQLSAEEHELLIEELEELVVPPEESEAGKIKRLIRALLLPVRAVKGVRLVFSDFFGRPTRFACRNGLRAWRWSIGKLTPPGRWARRLALSIVLGRAVPDKKK